MAVTAVEVVLRARHRLCSGCATGWRAADPAPACPTCGDQPLPLPHDHQLEIEFLD